MIVYLRIAPVWLYDDKPTYCACAVCNKEDPRPVLKLWLMPEDLSQVRFGHETDLHLCETCFLLLEKRKKKEADEHRGALGANKPPFGIGYRLLAVCILRRWVLSKIF